MIFSFVKRKFNAMLGIATITMSVSYIVMLSGSVIVGNLVGADGLAGVNMCTPVFGVASFIASLLSVGSGLIFSQAMGSFDEHRAAGVFSQSFGLACLFGLGIAGTMALGGTFYMDFMGVTGPIRAQAVSYWTWQTAAMSLTPLVMLMEALVYADGDGAVAAFAGACHVSGSIGFSILFTGLMGTAGGAAAGTALTMVIVLVVSSLHFLRKNNHLRFVRYWSRKDFLATCSGSLADATIYLCWGVLIMIVNKLVVIDFGERLLPVVALAASVVEFSIVFDGVGEALIPLGGMYAGEGNTPALRELARHSAFVAALEGLVCGVLFYALAPVLAPLYGIRGAAAELLPEAVTTIRILAFAMPFMGFLMMANTHYLVVGHVPFAVSVTVMKDFVLPCLVMYPCAALWGFRGIWVGFVIGYALAAAYPFVFVLLRHGRTLAPWLIKPDGGLILDFSVPLRTGSVMVARDRIERFLVLHKVPDLIVKRVMFAVEETGIVSARKHRGALAEYAVFLNKPGFVRIVTRDLGKIFNVNEATAFLGAFAERRYLNTLDCNRSEYVFKVES